MHELKISGLSTSSLIRVGPVRDSVWEWVGGRTHLMVSDETVYELYSDFFTGQAPFLISPGESSKGPQNLIRLLEAMARKGLDRSSCLVAVGGGVVSDLAMLAAGLYMRGIRVVVVSSTLLGQVDASVGGKCAVNLLGVKNLIGLFKQPDLVICDTGMLATLPEREWRSGLGELVKHALLQGPDSCTALLSRVADIAERDEDIMAELIASSLRFKLGVVEADEKETGPRRVLNLGHSFGHVYEAQCKLPHGEAVALGLVMALRCSLRLGVMSEAESRYGLALILALGLSTDLPALDAEHIRYHLGLDKKREQQEIVLVLLEGLGRPVLKKISIEEVVRVWPALCLDS